MTEADALQLLQQALWVTIVVASPIVGSAMVVGILISLIQALTQVQEATLTFVPKLMLGFAVMALTGNFIGSRLGGFAVEVYAHIERGFG
jgi:flagellar biosynthesis protein FliQ